MISDHLDFIYEMIYRLDDRGKITPADKKRALSLTTQLSKQLDMIERKIA